MTAILVGLFLWSLHRRWWFPRWYVCLALTICLISSADYAQVPIQNPTMSLGAPSVSYNGQFPLYEPGLSNIGVSNQVRFYVFCAVDPNADVTTSMSCFPVVFYDAGNGSWTAHTKAIKWVSSGGLSSPATVWIDWYITYGVGSGLFYLTVDFDDGSGGSCVLRPDQFSHQITSIVTINDPNNVPYARVQIFFSANVTVPANASTTQPTTAPTTQQVEEKITHWTDQVRNRLIGEAGDGSTQDNQAGMIPALVARSNADNPWNTSESSWTSSNSLFMPSLPSSMKTTSYTAITPVAAQSSLGGLLTSLGASSSSPVWATNNPSLPLTLGTVFDSVDGFAAMVTSWKTEYRNMLPTFSEWFRLAGGVCILWFWFRDLIIDLAMAFGWRWPGLAVPPIIDWIVDAVGFGDSSEPGPELNENHGVVFPQGVSFENLAEREGAWEDLERGDGYTIPIGPDGEKVGYDLDED